MELLKNIFPLIVLSLMFSACGDRFTHIPEARKRSVTASKLVGKLSSVSGDMDLSDDHGVVTVLSFSSDMCSVCNEEAGLFRDHLQDPNKAPTKVRLVTVLVGAILEDAQAWKKDRNIPWEVAVDTDATIFRSYCAEDKVPCLVVHSPDKGILMRHQGKVPLEEILKITGPWEDSK